jgi:sulfate adenylyltransferase
MQERLLIERVDWRKSMKDGLRPQVDKQALVKSHEDFALEFYASDRRIRDSEAEGRSAAGRRAVRGYTVFLTGLSGSGKSSIANALVARLREIDERPVTLLDGDAMRRRLSPELGFSKEHRDLNVLRVGYVASEITKSGGAAVCALIAPYAAARRRVREQIEPLGAFIEVYVATSLEECERRDDKGLYRLAREGKIQQFTGISDPYEAPENAEVVLRAEGSSPGESARSIVLKIDSLGLIRR